MMRNTGTRKDDVEEGAASGSGSTPTSSPGTKPRTSLEVRDQDQSKAEEKPLGFIGQVQDIVLGAWLNVLLIFVPIALISAAFWGAIPTFIFACLGLISLSERLAYATEQLAMYATPTIGGLLNATFGNLGELVFLVLSLNEGLVVLSQLYLLGSIIGNLLLILGGAFLVGGIRHYEQFYPAQGTLLNMGILLLGTLALLIPSLLIVTSIADGVAFSAGGSVFADVEYISRIVSVVLLLLYGTYLIFQLVTHVHLFDDEDKRTFEGQNVRKLGLWGSILWLALITLLIIAMAELIVETTEVVAEEFLFPEAFIAVILLPIVSNIAEHASAILFAYRNQMNITLTICIGSSIQIMIFMIPFTVLYSSVIGPPFLSLEFQSFESVVLFSTVIVTAILIQDGKSNWFKGVLLLLVYSVVGIGFWYHEVDLGPNGPKSRPAISSLLSTTSLF